MKIVQINTFPNKATGNIMMNIHEFLLNLGYESYAVWGRGRKANNQNEIVIKDDLGVAIHGMYTRITDKTGFASINSTKKLLKKLDEIKPDIIHLHNIHGYYINIELLFNYIKSANTKVIWTLHDCWSFTGHCAYFDMINCNKWKNGCLKCANKKTYPASYFIDNSSWNWEKKKMLFNGLDMIIVTPSKWLKQLVEQSFLKDYKVKVIYNGIDVDLFRPISYQQKQDIKRKYHLLNSKIVLGVASEWTDRKGLKDLIELSKISEDNYKIILVGLNEKQKHHLPKNIIGLTRTDSIQKLVELYSIADIFVNPTYEDNLPTTNIEAIACGAPIITYDTGGCTEIIDIEKENDNFVGKIIKKEGTKPNMQNVKQLNKVILDVLGKMNKNIISDKKTEKIVDLFNKNKMLNEYLKLYREI